MSRKRLPLLQLYGENYAGNRFNPHVRNIRTLAVGMQIHHCHECQKSAKKSCFEKLHICFCLAPIVAVDGKETICDTSFAINSPSGCALHTYGNEYKLLFKEAYRGKVLSDLAKSREMTARQEAEASEAAAQAKAVRRAAMTHEDFRTEARNRKWKTEAESQKKALEDSQDAKTQQQRKRARKTNKLPPAKDFKSEMRSRQRK